MKSFSALASLVFSSVGLAAQPAMIRPQHAAPPIVVPSAGALGGSFASVGISRPLGGIAPPTFPVGVPPRHKGPRPSSTGFRYVGPVYYTPNLYDLGYDSSSYSIFNAPAAPVPYPGPAPAAAPSQAPIIINQYFGTNDSSTSATETRAEPTANPGDPLGEPQKYYLIAYKDHSIYTALAYWVEGDIFHYVTTQNTHNQASLSLIDVEQTTKLNAGNSVPFSLSGR